VNAVVRPAFYEWGGAKNRDAKCQTCDINVSKVPRVVEIGVTPSQPTRGSGKRFELPCVF